MQNHILAFLTKGEGDSEHHNAASTTQCFNNCFNERVSWQIFFSLFHVIFV